MGIGVSIFLIALGAILTFAIDAAVDGIDLDAIGVILMVVGGLGLLASLLIFGPRERTGVVRERTVVRDDLV